MRIFHWSAHEQEADSGSTTSLPIDEQHDNEAIPFRSIIAPSGIMGDSVVHPYVWGFSTIVGAYLSFPSLDVAGAIRMLSIGRRATQHDYGTAHYPHVSTRLEPWTVRPPFAFVATFGVDTLDNDAWHMIGVRQYCGLDKIGGSSPGSQNDLQYGISALVKTTPAVTFDRNSFAGFMVHGGDPDGTWRPFRKNPLSYKGWPSPTAASAFATPLCYGGGPTRGPGGSTFNANKYAFCGGVLVTAAGVYGLIGGGGDVASEYRVVGFPAQACGVDLAYGGWEPVWLQGTNDTFTEGVDTAGEARVYQMSVATFENEDVEQMIGRGKVLVI